MARQPGSRIELNVRSLASRTDSGVQERAVGLLERLHTRGEVRFSVRVWGERVGLSTTAVETTCGQDLLERVGAYRGWANRANVSLEPFFESRATTSRITGEEYTELRLPVLAMAEYEDDEVVYVTPHEDGGQVRSVADRLDRLERLATDRGTLGAVRP